VSTLNTADVARRPFTGRRARLGDLLLQGAAGVAAIGATVIVGLIAWELVKGSRLSLSKFGLGFITDVGWDPVHLHFGAATFLFGTAITSVGALLIATPLAIGIALFLTELSPRWLRGPVTALVETLAAVPSVIIGLWGILVLAPVLRDHVEPALHSALGFIPLFGPPNTVGTGYFTAIIVLTIMIVPIISSISRELFLGVPDDLKEGAFALGATRWEMVRGVVLPYTRGGVAAATILGLGRALGEAIAVATVIGAFNNAISRNIFANGNTIGAWIALQFLNAASDIEKSSLVYLGLILLVLSLVVNLVAQAIVRRSARKHGGVTA
jgi:phosphate transport system permease protein